MKNKESVVLVAVQQTGYLLEYASEEMKNNDTVVLAAVEVTRARVSIHSSRRLAT